MRSLDSTARFVLLLLIAGMVSSGCPDDSPRGKMAPMALYDSAQNRFVAVYIEQAVDPPSSRVAGRVIAADGTLPGGEFTAQPGPREASTVAFDAADQKLLVVWSDREGLWGAFVFIDGSGDRPAPFLIDQEPREETSWLSLSAAFEPAVRRFVVLWSYGKGAVSGQILDTDGVLLGPPFLVNSVVASSRTRILVANDVVNRRILAVWVADPARAGYAAAARFIDQDGALGGEEIALAEDLPAPEALAYDAAGQRFLLAWTLQGTVHGRIVNADGTTGSGAIDISGDDLYASHVVTAFDDLNRRYLVSFGDEYFSLTENPKNQVFGRFVNADGSLSDPSSASFLISPDRYPGSVAPSLAFDPVNGRFLVLWEYHGTGRFSDIHGQLMDADGTIAELPFIVAR